MLKPTEGASPGCDTGLADGKIDCVVAMRCPGGGGGLLPILLKREGELPPFSPSPFLARLEGCSGSPGVDVRFGINVVAELEVGGSIDTDPIVSSRIVVRVRGLEGILIRLVGNEVLSLPSCALSPLLDGVPSLLLLFCGSLARGNDAGLAVACINDCLTGEKTGDVGGWHKIEK
jgi:hypothetical protein